MSMKLILYTPIAATPITEARVDNLSDHPGQYRLSYRLSLGFEVAGRWVEKRDRHVVLEGATYTSFVGKIKDQSLLPEEQILREALSRFPGTIAKR